MIECNVDDDDDYDVDDDDDVDNEDDDTILKLISI